MQKTSGVSTPAERRRRNREQMVSDILDTARGIMRENGVAALNLNEIARQLGIKTPSLYEYFPNKAAIYDALFLLGWQIFEEQVVNEVDKDKPFWEGMLTLFEAHMRNAHANPELFELMFQRPVPGFVPSEESMAFSQASADGGETFFQSAIDSGEIRAGVTLREVRDLIFVIMAGLGVGHIANDQGLSLEEGRYSSLAPYAVKMLRAAWGADAE